MSTRAWFVRKLHFASGPNPYDNPVKSLMNILSCIRIPSVETQNVKGSARRRTEPEGAAMQAAGVRDEAIRREILATLKVNPAASLDTVLGNWRYHRHGTLDQDEGARVGAILEDERAVMIKRQLTGED